MTETVRLKALLAMKVARKCGPWCIDNISMTYQFHYRISCTSKQCAKYIAPFSNKMENHLFHLQATQEWPRDGECRWWSSVPPSGRIQWTRQGMTVLTPCQTAGPPRGCVLIPSPARPPRCRACRPPWSLPPRRNRRRTWRTRSTRRELDPWGPSPRSDRPYTRTTSSVDDVVPFDDRRDIHCSRRSCDDQVPPFERTCPWQVAFCRRRLIANLIDAPRFCNCVILINREKRWTNFRKDGEKENASMFLDSNFVRREICIYREAWKLSRWLEKKFPREEREKRERRYFSKS